ncbi:MAG: type I DNA topoisomerase [Kiritimatiellae bacterium]|nr:type I DNA topoisomerase [Kiritimatiellia bacterium]
MAKKLVIVESPAKAKTINKMLGKEYIVKSSMGHVRDLPLKSLGVDLKDSFKPKYVTVKSRQKIITELKHAAKDCDTIYLAPDPDREGEAIAWHLKEILDGGKTKKEFFRIQYNEVTARGVKQAFENPGVLDMNRVDAQQARRILDRIVGYKVSPFLWRRIRRGLSAGRVQSVALRLVAERDAEIKQFVPEVYWVFGAIVRKLIIPLDPFRLKLLRIDGEKAVISKEEQVTGIKEDLKDRSLKVADIITKQISKRSPPPYITSTLQQAASSYCSFSPRRTMAIAQKLYEGVNIGGGAVGLITYMRTDSFNVADEALEACRGFIKKKFGDDYCPENPNFFKNRSSAQAAHEAIRPTDVTRTPESIAGKLDPSELKVYRLIWRRFVASQMNPAKIEQQTVKVETVLPAEDSTQYTFHATSSEVVFPGYMKVSGNNEKKKKEDNEENVKLPALSKGEPLECLEWLEERKETQPPSHYSEASLVRALESNGVGRPSTYAQTISTLMNREYVSREKRTLTVTDLGIEVNGLLTNTLGDLFNVSFTASMEASLDEIEKGSIGWTKMLEEFYVRFEKWMESTKEPPADPGFVGRVLSVLESVKEWAPEVKSGKRTYSDKRFVDSIQSQQDAEDKHVSRRQFETLLKIACRYKDQAPGVESLLKDIGYENILNDPALKPPLESTTRKLDILANIELDESARSFSESLGRRVEGGRRLSPAQLKALDNMVLSHSKEIEGFEEIKATLELDTTAIPEDKESGPLLAALGSVKTWKDPVTRGKRVFDDKDFFTSLDGQFEKRGHLSFKQVRALKRLVSRYKEQIVNYEELAEQYQIGAGRKASKKDDSSKD